MAESAPRAEPAMWETDVEHPAGGLWRVRTQDLQREPLQMPAMMTKVIADNRGRFMTFVYGPDGGQYKTTHAYTRSEAEEVHKRMVERVRTGAL